MKPIHNETNDNSASSAPAGGKSASGPRRLRRPNDIKSLALIKESTRQAYQAVYKDVYDTGVIDRRTKELIAIAAASVTGCEGCLMGHIRKARALGVTVEEIKEAVAVAFTVNAATVVDHTDVVAALLELNEE
ncbi:carboxymuconolactone decarboxylase family protein [Candidatus Sumerlaeota bacterium]|nr:carboxymuconolactone decarboxylase family protein [Candidatus Sumerlaeota bacterium]